MAQTDDPGENGVQGSGNRSNSYPASEANAVIRKFNAMSSTDKQAILDFLRSL